MYLPLHNVSRKEYFLRINFKKMCFFVVSLPLFAFFTCVLMTMYKDFESANYTHCNVPNIFPSISASIGKFEPQQTLWKLAIYSQAPIRFFIVFLRGQHFQSVIRGDFFILVKLVLILNILENLALLGVTYWSSTLYYPYHEVCFKIFIGSSIIYMLLTCVMLTKCRRRPNITEIENQSLKLKWRAFFVNVTSFTFAAYFFLRHNKLCEPYVYSMFGFSEYIVVISNMTFHLTSAYDLNIHYIYFTSKGLAIE